MEKDTQRWGDRGVKRWKEGQEEGNTSTLTTHDSSLQATLITIQLKYLLGRKDLFSRQTFLTC